MLEARGVDKTYQMEGLEVRALRGVDLRICEGRMLAVMGPSGSGKSTLMHIIGLLDRPTAGSVRVEGEEVSHMAPNELAAVRNKRIGFVFQSFNLLPRTSALANVELPLVYAGVGGGERARRARESLERIGLGDRLGHFSSQLSGGQQQRVAIARALVTEPSIVLADEPTGNLDSRSGVEVMSILQDLNRQGITIIVVTHDPRVAQHAERIVHLSDGRIVRHEIVEDRTCADDEMAEILARAEEE
ncbi:MAG: macrolide ABC transporter ATP-binding protein [Coriobacteriaceae bacterium]|nr:macrolide ABC transporter ATP-binding protein [Coriobacteriaceae bacterium]